MAITLTAPTPLTSIKSTATKTSATITTL